MKPYDHKDIEKKWQQAWDTQGLYEVKDSVPGKENYFALVEFTYPSGNLHVGHWYAFSVPDIFARYKRMKGYNVLYPMGFDAFGLPAENAAIKLGKDPKTWTYSHMEKMREQLRSMGAMFDWKREVVSCDPEYYKWTQWMFNQFLKKDLAYRATTKVNWCPKDKTILANEQVVDGKCDRCGTEVVQRDQDQWMLRITKYADRLVDDLGDVNWPESIKEAQRNWIGRSEGSEIDFNIVGNGEKITVFTTRADTLFGVTYVVLAPEHTLVQKLLPFVSNKEEVESYVIATSKKLELDRQQSKEKTGVELKGIKAINPANGEEVPVWIADYVLASYGTGAVMAVPAHDERDFEFAQKYNLPVIYVIEPVVTQTTGTATFRENEPYVESKGVIAVVKHWSEDKYLGLFWPEPNWGTFVTGGIDEGYTAEETVLKEIREEVGFKNAKIVESLGTIHSRYYHAPKKQNRFGHTPAFLVQLLNDEREEVSEEENSRHVVKWLSTDEMKTFLTGASHQQILAFLSTRFYTGAGLLANSGEFNGVASEEARKKITEAVGGRLVSTYRLRDWGISRQRFWGVPIPVVYDPSGQPHPVPDEHLPWLLPTDVDHTPDGTAPLARSKELFNRTEKIFGPGWKPEVETMDTFVDSSWYFYRYLDPKNDAQFVDPERVKQWMPVDLYMGGAEHTTMHVLYSRFWVKALHDLGLVTDSEPYVIRRNRGIILGPDGNKMSKSKGNVIDPDELVERLGADTVRMYLAFMGPYGVPAHYPWDPNGVVGVRRFLERVWKLVSNVTDGESSSDIVLHKAIKKIGEDIEEYKFNTAISQMMIVLNAWEKIETISKDSFKDFLKLLAPFAPHAAEELWHELDETESIHLASWPTYDEKLIEETSITLGVQVNGKVRGEITLAKDVSESDVQKLVMEMSEVKKWIGDSPLKKFIYVPGRIINVVI